MQNIYAASAQFIKRDDVATGNASQIFTDW